MPAFAARMATGGMIDNRGRSKFGTSPRGTALKYCNSDMICTRVIFAESIFTVSNFRGLNFHGRRTTMKYAKKRSPRKIPAIWYENSLQSAAGAYTVASITW